MPTSIRAVMPQRFFPKLSDREQCIYLNRKLGITLRVPSQRLASFELEVFNQLVTVSGEFAAEEPMPALIVVHAQLRVGTRNWHELLRLGEVLTMYGGANGHIEQWDSCLVFIERKPGPSGHNTYIVFDGDIDYAAGLRSQDALQRILEEARSTATVG